MWEAFSGWLTKYESLAIWLEGVALVLIFVWDRIDSRQQHRETLAQLSVSQAQANALINSERAWVMVDVKWDTDKWADSKAHVVEGSGTGGDTTGIYVALSCRNEGRSPAWIEEERARFQIVDALPDTPDLTSAEFVHAVPEPIGVGKANQISWPATATGHESLGKMMVVYGVVKYRDIFDKPRETTFAYRITPSTELVRLEGKREYNKHT